MGKTLCLVGHDTAPSECMDKLEEAIHYEIPSLTVHKIVGHGKPIETSEKELAEAVKSSDLVILGLSSSPEFARAEVFAGTIARAHGVPYGFYSDMPLCVFRAREGAWFESLAREASLIIGLLPPQVADLHRLLPHAKAVRTGNPIRDAMAFPARSREMVRDALGVAEHEKLILAPGGKFAAGNCAIWSLLVDAVALSKWKEATTLVISPHPGDTALRAIDSVTHRNLDIYKEVVDESPIRVVYATKDILPTLEMVVGADVVVEVTGSASVCAAYLRVPVLHIAPELWVSRITKEMGDFRVETEETGAGVRVRENSPRIIRDYLETVLELGSTLREDLRKAQEVAYPRPQSLHESMSKIVNVLKDELQP